MKYKLSLLMSVFLLVAGLVMSGLSGTAGDDPATGGSDARVTVEAVSKSNGTYRIDEPASWNHPPLKIDGSPRTLRMTIFNTGGVEMTYDVSTDHPSIAMSAVGTLPPGDSASVTGLAFSMRQSSSYSLVP